MKLKQLETIEEASTTRASLVNSDSPNNWGIAQGLITVGVLITLCSIGWLIYVMQGKPPAPKELLSDEFIEKKIESMDLLETYHIWSYLQQDIRQQMRIDRQYLAVLKEYKIRFWVAVVLVMAGLCLTLMTAIFARRSISRKGADDRQSHDFINNEG